jgi:A/G-specific adenine glycosylase
MRQEGAHARAGTQDGIDRACDTKGDGLRKALLAWYRRTKRDLPWRRTRDPYAIWLSEIMLQQTRVETVVPYFTRFLTELPTVHALAEAPVERVLSMWSGLGYYRRARMLHAAAKRVASEHGGVFPDTVDGLRSLEGVGAYTAGAVASIAFGRRAALVDGNVARVLARLFAIEDDVKSSTGAAIVARAAEQLVDERSPGDWNQALMELGATVCVPGEPRCGTCPVRGSCEGRARGISAELPRMRAKAKPREVWRVAVVAEDAHGHVALARRHLEGAYGGTWEPPSVERGPRSAEEAARELARAMGLRATPASKGAITHVLSHRKLVVEVMHVALPGKRTAKSSPPTAEYDVLEWVTPSTLREGRENRGTTSLARKILRRAMPT